MNGSNTSSLSGVSLTFVGGILFFFSNAYISVLVQDYALLCSGRVCPPFLSYSYYPVLFPLFVALLIASCVMLFRGVWLAQKKRPSISILAAEIVPFMAANFLFVAPSYSWGPPDIFFPLAPISFIVGVVLNIAIRIRRRHE